MKKQKLITKNTLINVGVAAAVFALLFGLVQGGAINRQYQSLLVPMGVNVILAVSLNLTVGFLGELTLGHAGFMSVGAYAGCLFSVYATQLPALVRFPLAMVIGGLVAAVFGVLIGIPVLRLKGDYLAIVTLAFGEIIRSVIVNLGFTGGAAGLQGIERFSNYAVVYAVILIMLVVITNLVHSRHGRAICAIRDNAIAAKSIGLNITYYKLLAFVVAAFFAGVAGVLYGHNLGILKPDSFDFNKSIEILVIVVLGGMGSIRGSIVSAVVITLLPEVLRGAADYRMLLYAIVLIVMMILNASPKFADVKSRFSIQGLIRTIREKKKSPKEVQ